MDGDQEKGMIPHNANLSCTLTGVNKYNSTVNDVINCGKGRTSSQSKQKHSSHPRSSSSSRTDTSFCESKDNKNSPINNKSCKNRNNINNNNNSNNNVGVIFEQKQKRSSHRDASEARDGDSVKATHQTLRQPMRSKTDKSSSSSSASTRSSSNGSNRSGANTKCGESICESTTSNVIDCVGKVLCHSTHHNISMNEQESPRLKNGGGKIMNGIALGGLVNGEEGRSKLESGMRTQGAGAGGSLSFVGATGGGANFEKDIERERRNIISNLICHSCHKMLQEPLQTPCCSHSFCSSCLLPDIVSKKTCPFCLAFPIDVQKLVIPGKIVDQLAKLEELVTTTTCPTTSTSNTGTSALIPSCSTESFCNNPPGCKETKTMGIPHINSYYKEKTPSTIVTSSNLTTKCNNISTPSQNNSQSERQLITEALSLMTHCQDSPFSCSAVGSLKNNTNIKRSTGVTSELDHDCLIQINSEKFKYLNCNNSPGNNISTTNSNQGELPCPFFHPKSPSLQNPTKHQHQLTHDCISHVTKLVQGLQMRVASLESELKTRHNKHTKREKSLLSKISTMQNELEVQALNYQERITNLTSQLYFTTLAAEKNSESKKKQQLPEDQSSEKFGKLEIVLLRDENGALGFNISGGLRSDCLSCPIFVSKVSGQSIHTSPEVSPGQQEDQKQAHSSKLQINDQIIMVNETSLEDVGHEEAVNIIKQSCDPVKFTVLRQIPRPPSAKTDEARDSSATILSIKTVCESEDKKTNTVACQTDPFLTFLSTSDWCDGDLPPLPSFMDDPELWGSMTDIENLACDTSNCNDLIGGADDVIADLLHLNSYDIEYEEVILEKATADEKLGITVCKGAPNSSFSQMFVSKVEESSVAAVDGRVSVGDQIVQINGIEVAQISDVSKLFERKEDKSISLLISRPLFTPKPNIFDLCEVEEQVLDDITASLFETENDDNDETSSNYTNSSAVTAAEGKTTDPVAENKIILHEEYPENIYDEPHENGFGEDVANNSNESPSAVIREEEETAAETVSCYMDKDSGLDCDSSTRNDSHSETGEHDRTRSAMDPFDFGFYTAESSVLSESNDYHNAKVSSDSCKPSGSVSFSQSLFRAGCTGTVQKLRIADNFEEQSISSDLSVIVRDEYMFSDEEDDGNVYENVDHILPDEEADEIKVPSPPPLPRPNMVTVNTSDLYQNLYSASKVLGKPSKNPVMDQSQSFSCAKNDKNNIAYLQGDEFVVSGGGKKESRGQGMKPYKQPKVTSSRGGNLPSECTPTGAEKGSSGRKSSNRKSNDCKITPSPSSRTFAEFNKRFSERSKMRRNESMLSIPAHAKQYRSYLQLVKLHEQQGNLNNQDLSSEWKVKIRPDGSRYITKVNAPNSGNVFGGDKKQKAKILRDRTEKLNKQRAANCFTTDDEAASEMKTGKYWSREERTRQYIVSMEKKHRKQMMENARLQIMDKSLGISLAQKKQMAGKAAALSSRDKILDTFITIQEIMTHGSNLSANPLLSVTTV